MNNMMSRQQAQAFGSYARDGAEGYAPANDDMSPWMMNRRASEFERWADSRREWAAQSWMARAEAQRMRRSARRAMRREGY